MFRRDGLKNENQERESTSKDMDFCHLQKLM